MKMISHARMMLLCSVLGVFAVNHALAQDSSWSSVGSAGTVDEADLSVVNLSGTIAAIASTAPASESVVLRYNVTNTPDVDGSSDWFTVRYRDNGASARVVAVLRQVDINTGASTTLATFDSNAFPTSTAFQTRSVGFGSCTYNYDFFRFSYYIEVTLSRTATTGTPALQLVQVWGSIC